EHPHVDHPYIATQGAGLVGELTFALNGNDELPDRRKFAKDSQDHAVRSVQAAFGLPLMRHENFWPGARRLGHGRGPTTRWRMPPISTGEGKGPGGTLRWMSNLAPRETRLARPEKPWPLDSRAR